MLENLKVIRLKGLYLRLNVTGNPSGLDVIGKRISTGRLTAIVRISHQSRTYTIMSCTRTSILGYSTD
jgi:hypothetical protein